ncbi:hypothetical protein HJC23_004358 [Cyclotella cryptica]|uniref:SAM-dependent MTase RsmB/NOP-type domain-containing protein n=1 Tax=Cyclotella cryptica TaxID=29204 RepID=A0ABD3NZ48_9STRA|eukprot:CCRYP_019070-RA/>CCRYP_019070-RA protein AED:0.40 eAED:0.40 QI:206/1/1/1/1/1/2/69/516
MGSNATPEVPEVLSLSKLKVTLPQDVYNHLARQYPTSRGVGGNVVEVTTDLDNILECMKTSPAETCCRVNLLKTSVDEVIDALKTHLSTKREKNHETSPKQEYSVQRHDTIKDLVIIRGLSSSSRDDLFRFSVPSGAHATDKKELLSGDVRRKKGWPMSHRVVIVDRFCAEAVLRGAHVFVKGILCADAGIKEEEEVAVYAHLSQNSRQVPRGLLLEHYFGKCAFLGIGRSCCKRSDYFAQSTGLGVAMVKLAGPPQPPLNAILVGKIMLQNLPSVVVAHALDPKEGDVILDMCCAPGGKTAHVASLIGNNGLIIACDKGRKKMTQAREFFHSMGATCIVPIAADSTKLLLAEAIDNAPRPKDILESATSENNDNILKVNGFYPESFDRILLDPPCSALGLRPKLQIDINTTEELLKHSEYQKQFIRCAIPLLKTGGTMTYSTCTINQSENEAIVSFILSEFPCMKLLPIPDYLPGLPALTGVGLSDEERHMIRRFDPCDKNIDSMGFFVAKFYKQ